MRRAPDDGEEADGLCATRFVALCATVSQSGRLQRVLEKVSIMCCW